VRTFNIIIPLALLTILNGQVKSIYIDEVDSLNIENIEIIEDTLSTILYNEDRLADSFELVSIDSSLRYMRNRDNIFVDTLIAIDQSLRPKIFLRMFESLLGTEPMIESNKQFKRIVSSNVAFTDSSRVKYGLTKQQNIGAVINLSTNYKNYFSGIFGASNNNNTWTINGQIDIHLENQWRTANILDLHWKRIDKESQVLSLLVEEPHPFNLPIGINVRYDQELRDGNYLSSRSSVGIVKLVPGIAKLGFGANSLEISATEQGDSLGIESLVSKSIYLNSIIDRRNDYWLPDEGHLISIDVAVGNRELNNISNNIFSILSDVEKYFQLNSKISILTKLYSEGSWVENGKVHVGEKARYGGINTLKGYNEDAYESDWVLIPTLELGAKLSDTQKIVLFTNVAYQNYYKELPLGYGIGFTQVSNNSVLNLFYALNKNDKLKNGKIHIQFLTLL